MPVMLILFNDTYTNMHIQSLYHFVLTGTATSVAYFGNVFSDYLPKAFVNRRYVCIDVPPQCLVHLMDGMLALDCGSMSPPNSPLLKSFL